MRTAFLALAAALCLAGAFAAPTPGIGDFFQSAVASIGMVAQYPVESIQYAHTGTWPPHLQTTTKPTPTRRRRGLDG